MNPQPSPPARPHGVRIRMALLVLAVLAGVVAMHGLGPGVLPDTAHAAPATGHAMPVSDMEPGSGECVHPKDGPDRHLTHADSTCAVGGTSGAPPLSAPLPDATAPGTDESAAGRPPAASLGGRAPPSLSELQLLRI